MKMKDLAKAAGVSTSAVSRFLNGGSLSEEKKNQIQQAIRDTGFSAEPITQMLQNKNTHYIGLILPEMDSSPVTEITQGASSVFAQNGYLTLLADSECTLKKQIDYLKLFQNKQVDGIILLATSLSLEQQKIVNQSQIPIVVIGQHFRRIPCIFHNDSEAAYDLTTLLLKKGRKDLAFIGVPEIDDAVGKRRRQGVEAALEEYGLDPALLRTALSDFTVEGGKKAMETLLSEGSAPDGILCATDKIAIGAMEVLKQHGLRIPEDVSIAGMDDSWFCQYTTPPLTTSHFYYRLAGENAAEMLLDLLRHKDRDIQTHAPIHQTQLGYTIIERSSI